MINLLPPDVKKDIFYARRNAGLLKWCTVMVAIIAGMAAISATGILFMSRSTKAYNNLAANTQADLESRKLDETRAKINDISGNLKLANQVLSKEILFSKLFKQIGAVMPANTSLSDLKISKTQGGIDLTALAGDYNSATQVQVNLADPNNKIFDKVDLLSLTCNSAGTADPRYPCVVSIRALFGKNTSFYLIHDGAKK